MLNDWVIYLKWNVFFLTSNDPVWEFVAFLKFLMMAAALKGCFGLEEAFHLFKESIRSW